MKKLTGQYTIGDREVAMSSPGENLIVTKVHVKHLFPHYKKENNVRVADELGYDTHGMAVTLAEDGYVIEEVHASVRTVQPMEFIKAATEDEIVSLLKVTMGLRVTAESAAPMPCTVRPCPLPSRQGIRRVHPVKLHLT